MVWCVQCAEFFLVFGESGSTMPRVVFSAEAELRLIELWGNTSEKSETMMKRAVAEKRIADELNLCAKQLPGVIRK